jgi:serine/threonine protein kinase
MEYVSLKNIVHRDLATRNILVVDKYHVKISDFGLARIIPKNDDQYKLKTERLLPLNWYVRTKKSLIPLKQWFPKWFRWTPMCPR